MPPRGKSAQREADEAAYAARQRARMSLPELTLHVYAAPDGVCVDARLIVPAGRARTRQQTIASVKFRPAEVTEEKVVQWGIGCLSTWLQTRAEAAAETQADPS